MGEFGGWLEGKCKCEARWDDGASSRRYNIKNVLACLGLLAVLCYACERVAGTTFAIG